ncbi:unnamed protein product [Sphagnum jensenii]|uniref:Uncharacterized protein n=1 Tax=Sphagnum jensenii TaxID=128206 RepID=A0ABP1A4J4_9BRYO
MWPSVAMATTQRTESSTFCSNRWKARTLAIFGTAGGKNSLSTRPDELALHLDHVEVQIVVSKKLIMPACTVYCCWY